jgi:hypothetical protein
MWITRGRGGEDGQAAVELVALLPALALCCALALQGLVAGATWWLASTSAREAARAAAVGHDPARAARAALPGELQSRLTVSRGGGGGATVRVRVAIPSLVGTRLGSVTVAARMEPQS